MKRVGLRQILTKRRIVGVVLWLCWAWLLIMAFSNVKRLVATYPTISLRYDTPIPNITATSARRLAAAEGEAGVFWPTFWTEQEDITVEGLHKASARLLWFSGDANLVWPAEFLQGGYPGPLEDVGCSVSDTLAWQLWGNTDAVGNELFIADQSYTVRGVFRGDDLLVMAGVGESAFTNGWQAVELAGVLDGDARNAALSFALSSGLGAPNTLVDGSAMTAVAGLLSALPLVAMGIALLIALLRWMARLFPGKGWIMTFVALLVFALALPALLEMLPPAFFPTRFSDFAFWGRLATTTWKQFREWLLLNPTHIDLNAKLLIYAQVGVFVIQSIISTILIRHSLLVKRGEHHGQHIHTERGQNLSR
jgi:hypothetical protein